MSLSQEETRRLHEAEQAVKSRFKGLKDVMDERVTRIWAGSEARVVGAGGIEVVVRATGLSRTTVRKGMRELAGQPPAGELVRIRRSGAGRPPVEVSQPGIDAALDAMVDPVTRGDPESLLRWTTKSTRELSAALEKRTWIASPAGHTIAAARISA